jgi:hypothetical protein
MGATDMLLHGAISLFLQEQSLVSIFGSASVKTLSRAAEE